MSEVYFTGLRAEQEKDNVSNKLGRLFRRSKMGQVIHGGDLVGIKAHFGELGNSAFLRPQYLAKIVDLVEKEGGKPFLTDCNTLYVGCRSNAVDHLRTAVLHGYTYPVVNAPVVIADGLKGKDQVEISVNLKRCRTVKIGAAAMQADSILCVSHFKGHMMTGFGGALKNLGMGFGSRSGKLDMHNEIRPKVNRTKCRGCGYCISKCPSQAISIVECKAQVDDAKCIGCGECCISCLHQAMETKDWGMDLSAIQEKVVEYCYGIMKDRKEKFGFVTFIVDVVPLCDCAPWNDVSIVPDIGILMSKDIVAIDQAAADLVNSQTGMAGTALKGALAPGEDKFKCLHDLDWNLQLEYAESLGLGQRAYKLVKVP
jgi:uncharacterized Fe-S center protein